jgi:hypothetical protein
LFDQRNETFLEGSQVKGTEHSTAQHSTVKERKFKERKMISIIASLIMSFKELKQLLNEEKMFTSFVVSFTLLNRTLVGAPDGCWHAH